MVGDDVALQAELIDDFLGTLEAGIVELSGFEEKADLLAYRDIAHRLKSSTRAFGARALGDLMSNLEEAAGSGDKMEVCRLHVRLPEAVEPVFSHFRAILAQRGAR
ncbi:MAG: Hpt domain-containing protein [Rhodospirillales bacterium]